MKLYTITEIVWKEIDKKTGKLPLKPPHPATSHTAQHGEEIGAESLSKAIVICCRKWHRIQNTNQIRHKNKNEKKIKVLHMLTYTFANMHYVFMNIWEVVYVQIVSEAHTTGLLTEGKAWHI